MSKMFVSLALPHMTALKTPEKTSRRQELRRNLLVDLYARLLLFYEDNRQLVHGLGVLLVALILAAPAYMYYQEQQQQRANEQLGQILPVYEQGNYAQALEGSDDRPGLLTIAEDYSRTDAGNLASFYAASALYQQGEYDRALDFYQQFDKSNDFLGASALAAQAAIFETRGDFSRAADYYERAADQYENTLTAPRYLLQAGQLYEEAGDYEGAQTAYRRIQEEYPDAEQAEEVARYLARAKARQKDSAS